ncbi:MAG: hypothetical protein RJA29_2472, partial [Pseudomonadota bacterium]
MSRKALSPPPPEPTVVWDAQGVAAVAGLAARDRGPLDGASCFRARWLPDDP